MNKLRSPDLYSFISEYDLIFLTETKLYDFDIIHINGFDCHTMNGTTFKSKSGLNLVKNSLSNNIGLVHGDTNCVIWFKSNVNLLGYMKHYGEQFTFRQKIIFIH